MLRNYMPGCRWLWTFFGLDMRSNTRATMHRFIGYRLVERWYCCWILQCRYHVMAEYVASWRWYLCLVWYNIYLSLRCKLFSRHMGVQEIIFRLNAVTVFIKMHNRFCKTLSANWTTMYGEVLWDSVKRSYDEHHALQFKMTLFSSNIPLVFRLLCHRITSHTL